MRPFLLSFSFALAACATTTASQPAAPIAAHWSDAQIAEVLDRTQTLHLSPDVSALSAGERAAVLELLAAGQRMQLLYLEQRHPQARQALAYLDAHPELEAQRTMFRLMQGPIATTLDNRREAFLDVAEETPARNMYPAGTTVEVFDAYLAANPQRREELLDDRSVVWAATPENRRHALAALDRYPALDALHPGLRERLRTSETYLGVPYSVAYAEDIYFVYERLNAAAAHVESGDAACARKRR